MQWYSNLHVGWKWLIWCGVLLVVSGLIVTILYLTHVIFKPSREPSEEVHAEIDPATHHDASKNVRFNRPFVLRTGSHFHRVDTDRSGIHVMGVTLHVEEATPFYFEHLPGHQIHSHSPYLSSSTSVFMYCIIHTKKYYVGSYIIKPKTKEELYRDTIALRLFHEAPPLRCSVHIHGTPLDYFRNNTTPITTDTYVNLYVFDPQLSLLGANKRIGMNLFKHDDEFEPCLLTAV